ncbi:Metacaspase 9 [Quillaja saponaria]|uniref:Metacaspase 9 n=1 Tax=Quillaja saponaria TaxID=32244 RepID=A0AAD7Q832_QUISA|nr:Metacaspase 9 [Quillaja saponaria]
MEGGKKRLAVLVGCNYPNTSNELHGCINDVLTMRDTLVKRFGFDPSNVQLLTDAPGSAAMPTGANIKKALAEMVDQAKAGDVLFFHYSGHGTRIPSLRPGHPFRQDEAIVPCDFNLITDLDFRQLVNRLPKRSKLHNSFRLLPYFDIGTHLLEFFGADASLRFRLPLLELDNFMELLRPDEGILLSGCQSNETSADMNPMMSGGMAYGAFSNAVQMVLKDNLCQLSNKEVVIMARKMLEAKGIEQHPCLYCSDENAGATFLWQPQS